MTLKKSNKFEGVYFNELKTMYKSRKDVSYYIKYYKDGKQKKEQVGKKSEGYTERLCYEIRQKKLADIKTQNESVEERHLRGANVTLNDMFKLYKRRKEATTKDFKRTEQRYNKRIKTRFGDNLLVNITNDDIYDFRNELVNLSLSNATVNNEITLIGTLFNLAISEKYYIRNNPAKLDKKLTVNNDRLRTLNISEIKILQARLRKEENDELYLFVKLSLLTGGRFNSIYTLKYKDIELKLDGQIYLTDFKNDEKYSSYLNDVEVLGLLKNRFESNEKNVNLNVFKTKERTIKRQLKKVFDELFNEGLEKDDRQNRVVNHTLRHTFATLLINKGVQIYDVQRLMNHKDIEQTMRYVKYNDKNKLKNIKVLTHMINHGSIDKNDDFSDWVK